MFSDMLQIKAKKKKGQMVAVVNISPRPNNRVQMSKWMQQHRISHNQQPLLKTINKKKQKK